MCRNIVSASLLLTAIPLLSGCDSNAVSQKPTAKAPKVRTAPPPVQVVDTEPVGSPIKGIRRIPIPQREHGYKNFESRVIENGRELKTFVDEIVQQPNWNNKDDFVSALNAALIDFKTERLLLIRTTAGSGSKNIFGRADNLQRYHLVPSYLATAWTGNLRHELSMLCRRYTEIEDIDSPRN